jgi:hypothetical protein
MATANADIINYISRRAALPDKPRKVSVSITRIAEGLWLTSTPVEDLDYLFALADLQRVEDRLLTGEYPGQFKK